MHVDVFSNVENTIPKSSAGIPRIVKRTYNHRKIKNGFTLYPSNKKQLRFIKDQKVTERLEASKFATIEPGQRQSYDAREFALATANRGQKRYESQADRLKTQYLVKVDDKRKAPSIFRRGNRDIDN